MNSHQNARLTFCRRLEMVQDITEHGLSVPEARPPTAGADHH
ncbi:hypothetical protein AB4Z48_28745 [Cupriavidus sp. 2TAF22]